ncbi:MAK10-like protein [Tanacetum coccineum]
MSSFMASQDARLSMFEADFKQQQSEMTNKIYTFLKAINDRMTGALPSDTVKNPKLDVNSISLVLSSYNYVESLELGKNGSAFKQRKMPEKMKDPGLFTLLCSLGDSKPFDALAHLGSCVNLILLYLFKKLKIRLLEETDHVFELAYGTKSYPAGIVKNVEVHIGRLKLLDDFYVIYMDKDLATSLLVGRGFLATANVAINCRKSKIAVGEGVTRSIFGVKEIDLRDEEKDVTDYNLPDEWEIARAAELNPFKDVLVFRRMVEFLGVIPINLKVNMWESKELIENKIDWDKPPKEGDGAWHAKIRLIDPDGVEFTKTFQSILTTRKLFEKENPSEIINLDHFHDS